ncbi:MAG TPA: choice-of-anchor D domain-containing protein [Terriglobales bacterium]|nr:choice-of-anchor D domain-containing protein [Terriglobales bacterium]
MTAFSGLAHGGATIVIVNQNAPGVGFNDTTPATPVGGNTGTTIGQQRLIAFQYAADIWGAALDSTVEIRINAQFIALSCTANSGTLGSAGPTQIFSNFSNAEFSSTWYHSALANKRAGSDLQPDSNDINANFNSNLGQPDCLSGSGWYYGLDTNHASDQVNLVTVVLHELAHGLGFSQFASTSTGAQPNGLTDIYGRRIFDLSQNKFWYEMSDTERVASAINTGNVVWTGSNVTAAAPSVLSGTPLLQITAPQVIAGSNTVGTAAFGVQVSTSPVSGQLLFATDATDVNSNITTDACSTITNAASIAGKIAMANRGNCTFKLKAKNVQDAGAIALVVMNNTSGPPPGMADDVNTPTKIVIPLVSVTQTDGFNIGNHLAIGVTVSGFIAVNPNVLAGADGQGRLKLNAPNPVQPGSSISHWDPATSRNQLMEPADSDDLTHSVKEPEDLTMALFRDIGWSANVAPVASFSNSSFDFGSVQLGTLSSRMLTISNSGAGPLSMSSFAINNPEDFSFTHNCLTALQPSSSCNVSVSFKPTTYAVRAGTLTISSNAAGSPHSIALAGSVIHVPLSLSRPNKPPRHPLVAGQSAKYELILRPENGFQGLVQLGCSDVPVGVSCSVSPVVLKVKGAPVTVNVMVSVARRSNRLRPRTREIIQLKVNAQIQGGSRSIDLPVTIER